MQNTILVHHLAATVHQHNPTPQSPHFQPVSLTRYVNSAYFTPISPPPPPPPLTVADNTHPHPGRSQFSTGTHIVMKAAACKIASLHPQAATKAGWWNAHLKLQDYSRSNPFEIKYSAPLRYQTRVFTTGARHHYHHAT